MKRIKALLTYVWNWIRCKADNWYNNLRTTRAERAHNQYHSKTFLDYCRVEDELKAFRTFLKLYDQDSARIQLLVGVNEELIEMLFKKGTLKPDQRRKLEKYLKSMRSDFLNNKERKI